MFGRPRTNLRRTGPEKNYKIRARMIGYDKARMIRMDRTSEILKQVNLILGMEN